MANSNPAHSSYGTGLRCRCPRWGTGIVFSSLLEVGERCFECELDLSVQDSGNGPAVFVIFISGLIVTGLAFWFEMAVTQSLWLNLVLWIPLITVGLIALLWSFNAVLVVLEFRHKAGEAGTRTFE